MEIRDTFDATVIRGPVSWAYIYVALGFTLTIEGTLVQMMPLQFPWNILAYAVFGGFTFWLFILNGWFQNKLIALKSRYESQPR